MFTFFFNEASPFSQWYRCKFEENGLTFTSAEQYMMYRKAVLFGDDAIAAEILDTDHPRKHKALGRQVRGFDEATWSRAREEIVRSGNYAKFTQNPELREQLFSTCGTTLVEANPYDRIWGIGLAATDARAQDPKQWRGQNLLGRILTEIREQLLRLHECSLVSETRDHQIMAAILRQQAAYRGRTSFLSSSPRYCQLWRVGSWLRGQVKIWIRGGQTADNHPL